MALFTSLDDFCQFQVQLLVANMADLGIASVFYGDQQKLPNTPVVCVEPNNKARSYLQSAVSPQIDLLFENYILVYASKIQDNQLNTQDAVVLAEQIVDLLDVDNQMGHQVISSMVTLVEYGIASKAGSLYRSARVTFTGRSRGFKPQNLS